MAIRLVIYSNILVCCLTYDNASKHLVSGSWDKTGRVWRGRDCIAVVEGHEAAVWAVAIVPSSVSVVLAFVWLRIGLLLIYTGAN